MAYLIKATLVIAVFYLCYNLGLKRETFFQKNRWFLLLGLLSAVFLPLVVIPIEVPVEPVNYSFRLIPSEIQEVSPAAVPEQGSEFNWPGLLMTFYIIGLCLFLIQFLLQLGSLVLLLLRNPKLNDGLYTYVFVKRPISPFSFFKWIVYNPDRLSEKDEKLILTHEKIHVNELHSIDILLSQFACTVFWFNPLIWFYQNDLKQNLEYIADHNTQQRTSNRQYYQKLLLKTSVKRQQISLTNNFYNSLIKNRILMLQKSRSQTKRQWRYLLVLPLLGIVLMSMSTKTVYVEQTSNGNSEQTTAHPNPKIEIIFTKSITDQNLEKIKKLLKTNGISMNIKTLLRNEKGDITSINVDFVSPDRSVNYAVMNEEGIPDFYFRTDEDGSFGVGAAKNPKKIVVTGVKTDHNNNDDSKQEIIIHKDQDDTYDIIIEEDTNTDVKIINGKSVVFKKGHDSEIIIELDSLATGQSWTDANSFSYELKHLTDTIHIKKDVHVIKAPGNKFEYEVSGFKNAENYDIEFIDSKSDRNPLFIINGEAKDDSVVKSLNSDKIKSVTVLKDDKAVSLYGKDAKNGVVIIETDESEKVNTKSKWVISKPRVNSIVYMDDEDARKNSTLAYISKDTPDDILEKNKYLLEQSGLTVKYSKIRRNKAGKMTSIKIRVRNKSGDESSASWKNDDGIPSIEYGMSEGALIARISKMNFNKD